MKIVDQIIKNTKISLFLGEDGICFQAYIFNYHHINDFSTEKIDFLDFSILGSNLLITRMEDEEIEINGTIQEIKFKKE